VENKSATPLVVEAMPKTVVPLREETQKPKVALPVRPYESTPVRLLLLRLGAN
jgi:hypothetical protein